MPRVPALVLLGPQRTQPTLPEALRRCGIDGPVAAITAGWEEREREIEDLRAHLPRELLHLQLYARAQHVFKEDPELIAAYRERRARLRELHELYVLRLNGLAETFLELERRKRRPEIKDGELASAMEFIRDLDEHHLARSDAIYADFNDRFHPQQRASVDRHRQELGGIIDDSAAVVIAGGNVAVLLNRLRLFGVADLLQERPVFAWSAGAMALSDLVTLFHDHPPQGPGNSEILARGLGIVPGVLPFPHASERLRLDDAGRVGRLVRRLAPRPCIGLDDGGGAILDGPTWRPFLGGYLRLGEWGTVDEVRAA